MIAVEHEWNLGFSLIELLMTLSIIGILVGIAYPSYLTHLYKVRRVDGQIALLNVAWHLQKYYAEHQEYTGAALEAFNLAPLSPQKYYTVSMSVNSNTYTLTATPTKPQSKDKCQPLTLNESNERGPSLSCWR